MKSSKKYILPYFYSVCISILMWIFLWFLLWVGTFQKISQSFNDIFTYRLAYTLGYNQHNDDIVIVKIDDRSFDMLGRSDLGISVFDKWVYAEAIKTLFETYKVQTIWVDIVFANPSLIGKEDELKLKDIWERYKDQLVIATRISWDPHPLCLYSTLPQWYIDKKESEQIRYFDIQSKNYDIRTWCPEDNFLSENTDGITSLSRSVLEKYISWVDPFSAEKLQNALNLFERTKKDTFLMEYYSNGRKNIETLWYQSVSLRDILEKKTQTPEGEDINLAWKIILIWEVGTLIHDAHITPLSLSRKIPWVEINAHIISTMMQGRIIDKAPPIYQVWVFFIFQVICVIAVFILSIGLSIGVWIFALTLIIWYFWFYTYTQGYIFDVFFWTIWLIVTFFSTYMYRFQVSDKAKRLLKKQFWQYVSPDIVEELSKNPNSIMLKWELREMSIFFSDIVSFTSISEKMDPEMLLILLNEYFEAMTRIILKNNGTLDKYIWDAVMCFFGAPLKLDNHSFYACDTALKQQSLLKKLNENWKQRWFPEIKIRIGIHSGKAIHGNIWNTDSRVNYTVVGDSVNLAARLESICKHYGIYLCVSEQVFIQQKEHFYFRELDKIEVKGRTAAVTIYQLLAPKTQKLDKKTIEYLERYALALALYRSENYSDAQALFSKNIGDIPSETMSKRCQDIQDWKAEVNQGVFHMLTK